MPPSTQDPAPPVGPAEDHDPRWGKNPRTSDELVFLEGPRGRGSELARVIRISAEFIRGFRTLHFVGPCVTVFGSARFKEDHRYYAMARALGAQLGRAGFTVMTGGGPGIMEAANRGAKDVGAKSMGCNIELPMDQSENPYLDRFVTFRYFFVRKVMLAKYSYGFVAMPGGFGTLDEMFEIAVLVQTGKVADFPLVLMGRDYWSGLIDFVTGTMLREGTIDPQDARRVVVTDSPEEAAEIIKEAALRKFGLRYAAPKRRWWLLET
jgi:uncharacterized protein (TIGR00730 family)